MAGLNLRPGMKSKRDRAAPDDVKPMVVVVATAAVHGDPQVVTAIALLPVAGIRASDDTLVTACDSPPPRLLRRPHTPTFDSTATPLIGHLLTPHQCPHCA
ncbi:hypothetical protein OsI_13366 [Oryza sativa Indica Group]|uniref:Uncharacterized protein n=1 Tax=Oryza sativa subsp. indica TaxID=39946 RepID=B8AR43_ORYSI|nr:hypothetical protein OsI_13366 [Oryza sativa Indica Group]